MNQKDAVFLAVKELHPKEVENGSSCGSHQAGKGDRATEAVRRLQEGPSAVQPRDAER